MFWWNWKVSWTMKIGFLTEIWTSITGLLFMDIKLVFFRHIFHWGCLSKHFVLNGDNRNWKYLPKFSPLGNKNLYDIHTGIQFVNPIHIFLFSWDKGTSMNDVRIYGEGGVPWNSDFTNKGSVNRIRKRGREGVKKDPQNSDIIYGYSIRPN